MRGIEKDLPKVAVIACGGTIGSVSADTLDVVDYPDCGEKVPLAALLARVPETEAVARIERVDFRAVSSSAIGIAEWFELRGVIERLSRTDVAGVAVLHGTGTLEETAFFLHLTLALEIPVVFTGAQRPASAVSSDAGMNLVNAIRVAASPAARGKGVLVALNDEIHSARDVVKLSTTRLQTFQAPGLGPLGFVDGDGVFFRRAPLAASGGFAALAETAAADGWPRVDIVYSYAGSDGLLIEAAVQVGARGIVSAAFAPGIPTPQEQRRLLAARAAGVAVAESSRAAGRVPRRRRLGENGIVSGEDFSPQKARILLALCLASGFDHAAITDAFRGS